VLAKLNKDSGIRSAFESAYGTGPSREAVLDALAAFQRSLSTPNARFDRYLRGDATAITADEKRGYELFKAYGCIACHQGRNVGGNLFQKFGIFSDPFAGRQDDDIADQGRFAITGRESDRRVFRVPSLRNVALTAPYFHDGSADTLDAAVTIMAQAQLGRTMPQEDRDLIIAFLGTLTGEYEGRPLSQITAAEAR
jgi:cytochrome c peroxidase